MQRSGVIRFRCDDDVIREIEDRIRSIPVIAPTGVVPGSYTNANITVDKYGRILSASNGSSGVGNHALLTNLDYDSSGHIGFARAVHNHLHSNITDWGSYIDQAVLTTSTPTFAGLTVTSGINVGSASGAGNGQVFANDGSSHAIFGLNDSSYLRFDPTILYFRVNYTWELYLSNTNLAPYTDLGITLGSSSLRWNNIYSNSVTALCSNESFYPEIRVMSYNSSGYHPYFAFFKAGGTFGSPTQVTNGMNMGIVGWRGRHSSGSTGDKTYITVIAREDWTSSSQGASMHFALTAIGSTNIRYLINLYDYRYTTSSGDKNFVQVNPLVSPTASSSSTFYGHRVDLYVDSSENISSVTAGYFQTRIAENFVASATELCGLKGIGFIAGTTVTFGIITNVTGGRFCAFYNYTNPLTGSISNARGILVDNSSRVSSSLSVANLVGIHITEPTLGSTSNIALLIGDIPDGGDYTIYSSSTKNSYLNGNLKLGDYLEVSNSGGIRIVDTSGSNRLKITTSLDMNIDRILYLNINGADRTITLGGNLTVNGNTTLNDWFNQDVKSTATPTFTRLGLGGSIDSSALLKIYGQFYANEVNRTAASSLNIDWNQSNVQRIYMSTNITSLTFSNGKYGGVYFLVIRQDYAGGRTITFPANIKWVNGTAPTLSSGAGKVDVLRFIFLDENYYYGDYYLNC